MRFLLPVVSLSDEESFTVTIRVVAVRPIFGGYCSWHYSDGLITDYVIIVPISLKDE